MIVLLRWKNICKYGLNKSIQNVIYQRKWIGTSATQSTQCFKKEDKIDDEYKLIYTPPDPKMLIIANTFLSCSAYASPPLFIASYYAKFVSENPEVQNAVSNGQIAMIAVASVVSTILVYFIRSFPLRIYKNKEQQYIAILPGTLMSSNRQFPFKKGDMQDKEIKFTDKQLATDHEFNIYGFFKIKNKSIFLISNYFSRPNDLLEMFADTRKYVMQIKRLKGISNK